MHGNHACCYRPPVELTSSGPAGAASEARAGAASLKARLSTRWGAVKAQQCLSERVAGHLPAKGPHCDSRPMPPKAPHRTPTPTNLPCLTARNPTMDAKAAVPSQCPINGHHGRSRFSLQCLVFAVRTSRPARVATYRHTRAYRCRRHSRSSGTSAAHACRRWRQPATTAQSPARCSATPQAARVQ